MPRSKNGAKQNPRSAGLPEKELGTRIRLRRVEQKLSQAELGAALGVSFQQIQKYEKGNNRVGAHRLQLIAEALDVPVSFFFGGSDKEREYETLLFHDSPFSLRLLKAYNALDEGVARKFVSLMESVVAGERRPRLSLLRGGRPQGAGFQDRVRATPDPPEQDHG
jgi:transcriptional regulator with XRE-family HTH domain